jgi:hypothetical protein
VYRRIDDFFKVFENPNQVIQKRAMKIIDYDRVKDLKSKGDVPDKALQESADVYVSINAQLVDELPKFFELTMKYFEIILADLATVQSKFYARLHKEWVKLVEQNLGLQAAISYEAIVSNQVGQMSKMADKINDITILNKHRNRSNSLSSRESQDINSIRSFGKENEWIPRKINVY